MGRELEYKFRAEPGILSKIRENYGEFHAISMETAYYDTQDLKLSMHHWMLRRRLENGVSVCTVKTPLEDGSRGEWETPGDNVMEAVMALCRQGAPWELLRCCAGGLMVLCGARFTRLAARLALPECTVELALDQGVLLGRGKEIPLCEVEVEFLSGSEEAAEAFAGALAEEFCLELEPLSKFARARALALA